MIKPYFKLATISVLLIVCFSACGSKSYHQYALTHTMNNSNQKEHLEALQGATDFGVSRQAHACIYFPKELGGFSSGCGELTFNPYQLAAR